MAGLGLDLQRVAVAERRSQARVDVRESDPAADAGEQRRDALGLDPAAVVRDPQLHVAARDARLDRDPATVTAALDAVTDRVLDQRLDRERGDDRRPGLGRDVEADVKPVAEAGLLEAQVSLDVGELVGDGDIRPAVTEQISGELREVDQQLARLLGSGVDVARDGGERVVDEMRADLCPQRAQFGPREALLLLADHRQLELRRDEARRLLHDAQLVASRPPDVAVERDQRPGSPALDDQRRKDS